MSKNTTTKGDFAQALAGKLGVSGRKASDTLSKVLDTIVDELKSGNSVQFTGFGKFETVQRGARAGRNPATKEPVTIPAKTAVVFRTSTKLKEAVQ
ncbi:integration host factor subunit alpha [Clostridia bacterium]|nr:integration host factor subunit alpha [Clostridia bacterium]